MKSAAVFMLLWFSIFPAVSVGTDETQALREMPSAEVQLTEIQKEPASFQWGPYRGFNGRINLDEQAIADMAATGANLFRATAALHPLMDKEPPYDINMENVALLDRVIDACEKHGIRVVINPHTTPGTQVAQTTRRDDPLWNDYYWHGHLLRLWAFLAGRYRDRGEVIAGYDLLNEPYAPGDIAQNNAEPGPGNWNELLARLVQTVRYYDKKTPLIIETVVGKRADGKYVNRIGGTQFLQLPADPYLVLSPHVYVPGSFTHQGLMRFPAGLRYPGVIEGAQWNKAQIATALQPLIDFQQRTGVPVFIGEFSASLQGGQDADKYLADLVDVLNEKGWSWAYHSWREAPTWDAERTQVATPSSGENTERLQVLRNGIALRAAIPEGGWQDRQPPPIAPMEAAPIKTAPMNAAPANASQTDASQTDAAAGDVAAELPVNVPAVD